MTVMRNMFLGKLFVVVMVLLAPSMLYAQFPRPFSAEYRARYGGFQAWAVRELRMDGENELVMASTIALNLFGKTLSSIHEESRMNMISSEDFVRPQTYHFQQQGLGKRQRQILFDWEHGSAQASDDKHAVTLSLEPGYMDSLSGYLEIGRQLSLGQTDIRYTGIEKNEVKVFHFQVEKEEILNTPLGNIRTIQLSRIREDNNQRQTLLWLAPDQDYLLVKLEQREPGEKHLLLELTNASLDGIPIQAE